MHMLSGGTTSKALSQRKQPCRTRNAGFLTTDLALVGWNKDAITYHIHEVTQRGQRFVPSQATMWTTDGRWTMPKLTGQGQGHMTLSRSWPFLTCVHLCEICCGMYMRRKAITVWFPHSSSDFLTLTPGAHIDRSNKRHGKWNVWCKSIQKMRILQRCLIKDSQPCCQSLCQYNLKHARTAQVFF